METAIFVYRTRKYCWAAEASVVYGLAAPFTASQVPDPKSATDSKVPPSAQDFVI